MSKLPVLILSDGRPGHYHLAEGVAAAIGRRRPVEVTRIDIRRRPVMSTRLQAAMVRLGVPAGLLLRLGYGLDPAALPEARLVISAGGDTIGATVATARVLAAESIFCGTLRHFPPEAVSLVVSSYARHSTLPRHLVALKPNGLDPDTLAGQRPEPRGAPGSIPAVVGLLIGGNSGLFTYSDEDWSRLLTFLQASHDRLGIRWIVSTSRRSPDQVGDRLAAMTVASDEAKSGAILRFIDFRTAGPGTLPELFGGVDAILATEDSSTMLSEAVCARLPVVGVSPTRHGFKEDEREYRALMTREGWLASLPLAELTPEGFADALGKVRPLAINHLDVLADGLMERLPDLFSVSAR